MGDPWDTPVWGLVAVAQDTTGYDRVLCSGVPWTVYREDLGHWQELDTVGFHDVMLNHARYVTAVRPGRFIPTPQFKAIWQQARDWANGQQ